MIEAHGLTRRYGDFAAASDVTFDIPHGQVVGLLGHNGAGKTTVMKMLTGFLEPSDGYCVVDGIEVEKAPLQAQQRLGYLPENLPLYPELTVSDYLAFAAELRGVDPADSVPDAIAATELFDKALARIGTLSRGYKQRVGVAQAILHKPQCLILDEPTNGLDPSQTQHMRSLIRTLAEQATVILSTHIMQEVSAVCDRALIMRGGKLVLDERLDALQDSGNLQVRTDERTDLASIGRDLAVVSQVNGIGAGRWTVEVSGNSAEAAAAIAAGVVAAGGSLYELISQQRDLETVFRQANEEDNDAI